MSVREVFADSKAIGSGLSKRKAFKQQLKEQPHLRCFSGPCKGEESFVGTHPFRVGRGHNNQFVLNDPNVDGVHFVITKNALGNYTLTAAAYKGTPIFARRWGRYREVSTLALTDKQVFRLGKQGPKIQYRYLGTTNSGQQFSNLFGGDTQGMELLPETQVRTRLDQMVVHGRLADQERHYVRQASSYLSFINAYRRWFLILSIGIIIVLGAMVYFKTTDSQKEIELARTREQLKQKWSVEALNSRDTQPADGATADERADAMLANDRTARGIMNVMAGFGIQNPNLTYTFVNLVKAEVERERTRMLLESDLEGFLERYRRYHARIEDIFRKEFSLPPSLAYVAWIESDYWIDAESEKGALGMWQFIVPTAIDYQLITPKGEDFRQDFERSTRAAGRFLSDLLAQFGMDNFMIALSAYNWGPRNVLDVFKKYRLWQPSQRSFPFVIQLRGEKGTMAIPEETMHYVPRFFAANLIGSDLAFYIGQQ